MILQTKVIRPKKTNTALEGSAQMYNYGEVSEVNTIDQSRVSQIEQLEKDKVQLNDIGSATDSAQKGRDTISQFLSNFEDSSVNFDNLLNLKLNLKKTMKIKQ